MSSIRLLLMACALGALAFACDGRDSGETAASAAAPDVAALTLDQRPERRGGVHLERRAFADESGPFNALGATLFWALWGERHDPDRLDANLAHLAAHDVDYVRILAMVGSESWADRIIDPDASDYWATARRFFDRLSRHRLRAQIVLFADAQVMMPDPNARVSFADAWVAFAAERRDRIQLIEIANEYYQNGLDTSEVQRLGARVRGRTDVPVALSAPPLDAVRELYAGWPGVATLHYDRDRGGEHGTWGPVLQPWSWADVFSGDAAPRIDGPAAVVNNEPIGPGASVVADDDPVRLAAGFVATFLAGNAAYVYHTGAGIRGGGKADRARGRVADIVDEPAAVLDALAAWRRSLPPGLANWQRVHASDEVFPWAGAAESIGRADVRATPAAVSGRQAIVLLVDQRAPIEFVARGAMHVRLLDLLTASERASVHLEDEGRWAVPAIAPASVLVITRN